jgi:hypothetical protein
LAQQDAERADEAAEVGAGGGEDGVGCVAATEPGIIAAHAVLGFEMADDGLDGRPAAQFTFDLGRHPSLLAGDEDPELVIGRRIVAAISLVGEEATSPSAASRTWRGSSNDDGRRNPRDRHRDLRRAEAPAQRRSRGSRSAHISTILTAFGIEEEDRVELRRDFGICATGERAPSRPKYIFKINDYGDRDKG